MIHAIKHCQFIIHHDLKSHDTLAYIRLIRTQMIDQTAVQTSRPTTMKEKMELPSICDVAFSYKKPKKVGPQMLFSTDFRPQLKDAPTRTREIPKSLIERITHPCHSAGKRAVGSIPCVRISIER